MWHSRALSWFNVWLTRISNVVYVHEEVRWRVTGANSIKDEYKTVFCESTTLCNYKHNIKRFSNVKYYTRRYREHVHLFETSYDETSIFVSGAQIK